MSAGVIRPGSIICDVCEHVGPPPCQCFQRQPRPAPAPQPPDRPCAIIGCPRQRIGTLRSMGGTHLPTAPLCPHHEGEFLKSIGFAGALELELLRRPTAIADFRDRVWKETCVLDEARKRAQAEQAKN